MSGLGLIAAAGLAVAAPPAGDAEAAAQRLVSALTLPTVTGFDLRAQVAIASHPRVAATWGPGLAPRAAGLLAQLGLPAPTLLGPAESPTVAAEAARRAGAEWLLWLQIAPGPSGRPVTQASLLSIEPEGLWGPAPTRPAAFALAEVAAPVAPARPVPVEPTTSPPPAPPPPAQGPSLVARGPPLHIATLPARVLDVAACRRPRGPERLVVLTEDAVLAYEDERGHLRPGVTLDLRSLPRAPTPTRDPVGQVVCRGDDLAFGHGRLAAGHRVTLDAASEPWVPLPGLPHGFDGAGRVLSSPLARGLNRHEGPASWTSPEGGDAPDPKPWGPGWRRSVDLDRPEGWRRLTLGLDDRWRPAGSPTGPSSGYGASARAIGARVLVVVTSNDAGADADVVQVLEDGERPLGPPLPIEGEVHASAVLRRLDDRLGVVLAAWRPELRRTQLLLVTLEARP